MELETKFMHPRMPVTAQVTAFSASEFKKPKKAGAKILELLRMACDHLFPFVYDAEHDDA